MNCATPCSKARFFGLGRPFFVTLAGSTRRDEQKFCSVQGAARAPFDSSGGHWLIGSSGGFEGVRVLEWFGSPVWGPFFFQKSSEDMSL